MSEDDPERVRGGAGPSSEPAFDSHLHLTDPRFDQDRPEVLARARDAGVAGMVTVATEPGDARRALELARGDSGIWTTAGIHPHEAERFSPASLGEVETLLAEPEVVAVGETGLDFHYERAPRRVQGESFEAHLELAVRTGLPAVVHSREADRETADAIRSVTGRARGVLHCFTGGESLLEAGLEAGWFVSFSGLLTFVSELEPMARRVPDDRLLVETDSPYLSPVPRRGRRNEPAHLRHTLDRLAELRGEPVDATARLTRRNAERFYGVAILRTPEW